MLYHNLCAHVVVQANEVKAYDDKFRAIFDASPDTIMLLGEDGFLDCNPATLEMFCCTTTEEFLGRHPGEYSPPLQPDGRDSREAAQEKIAIAYATGSNLFEWTHQRANGDIFPAEVQLVLLKLADGDVIQATVRDISERNRIIAANRIYIQQLENIRRIYDASIASPMQGDALGDVIAEIRDIFHSDRAWLLYPCDPDSDKWEVPFESTAAEYPGACALNQKFPVSEALAHVFIDVLNSAKPVVYCPMPSLGSDMDQFAVRSQMLLAIKPKFGPRWLLGLHQCAHERVWTDEEMELFQNVGLRISDMLSSVFLNRDLQKLSQAVQQAGEAVMITDRNAVIEYVNPAFSAITGYSPEEIIGKTPSVLKSSAQDPAFYKELWDTVLRGETWHGTLIDRRKDGSFYPALMSVAPITGDHGETTHFVSLQQDMTEYKRLEDQFIQSQKMEAIGTLVGGIAHDFNNMLAAMQGNLYLAKTELQGVGKVAERLDNIELLSQRAADMVAQLLTFARKDRVSMQAFSLNEFMKEGFKLARNAIPENIEHICDVCPEELVIKGDATQLQQALMNLLTNATHAVAGVIKPQIACRLRHYIANDSFVREHPDLACVNFACLSVSDNGCGISNAHLHKVFEPFFTTKGVGEGTGLGLAMVHGAIQTHGGVVEVETGTGKGTTFHIYLPLGELEAMPVEEQAYAAVRGQQETVLLVDDETAMREAVGEVLTTMGYTVLEAADGEQALQLFKEKQHTIDLVITDIVMPSMGGVEAVRQMRLLNSALPVVFMTGYDKNHSIASIEAIDGAIILSKPFSIDLLNHTLRRLMKAD